MLLFLPKQIISGIALGSRQVIQKAWRVISPYSTELIGILKMEKIPALYISEVQIVS